jgi:hypothetical protein
VKTRKPGDLPSAVVTRDHVGRGAADMSQPASATGGVGRLGRGDMSLTSLPEGLLCCVTDIALTSVLRAFVHTP